MAVKHANVLFRRSAPRGGGRVLTFAAFRRIHADAAAESRRRID
ncbi:hypothetical protein HMPREF0043_00216 [Actinobaculum sp. oral taxon 183 str. F0552]|nr:hypothetical protein HMPREF0043_00216 [Actinobaculum sp. oral taxon 183 str. F0552]